MMLIFKSKLLIRKHLAIIIVIIMCHAHIWGSMVSHLACLTIIDQANVLPPQYAMWPCCLGNSLCLSLALVPLSHHVCQLSLNLHFPSEYYYCILTVYILTPLISLWVNWLIKKNKKTIKNMYRGVTHFVLFMFLI